MEKYKKIATHLDPEEVYKNIEDTPVKEFKGSILVKNFDVEKELEKNGWMTRIVEKGQAGIFSYQQEMAKLFLIFKNLTRNIAFTHGFEEMIFPRHYSQQALDAMGWPAHHNLKKELMLITRLHKMEGRSNDHLLGDPLQCTGFYDTLKNMQDRNGGALPAKLFSSGGLKVYEDQGGWTVRNEPEERLRQGFATGFEFAGAEIVWAAYEEDGYKIR